MQLMQMYCSLPGALFNFKSPVQKSPSTVSQAEAHIQTTLFYTVFHIFLMVLIKSVIKLNYIPAHQWNFYIFLELLTATYPLSLNTHCRWSPRPLLKDSRCGSCTLGWGRCILLSFHSGSIPHMPNLYRWDPLTLNAEIFLFDETQNLNDKFGFFLVMC